MMMGRPAFFYIRVRPFHSDKERLQGSSNSRTFDIKKSCRAEPAILHLKASPFLPSIRSTKMKIKAKYQVGT